MDEAVLCERITAYLSGGGLFNPELAIHDAVRDLLIDCRAALAGSVESPQRSEPVAREVLQSLVDSAIYTDSYGVPGSDFRACRICDHSNQPGLLSKPDWHPITCKAKQAEDWLKSQRSDGIKET